MIGHWLAILGVALVTFALRASFIAFADPQRFPPLFRRALVFVPPAVLAAIVLPGLVAPQGVIDVTMANPRWIAGLAAMAVALRLKKPMAAIVAGMGALWLLQWLLKSTV
ncbi:MAG: AzlD domain-containing protein [Bacillota bacterium]